MFANLENYSKPTHQKKSERKHTHSKKCNKYKPNNNSPFHPQHTYPS
ncbi:protein of unknown function [Burkholderia multivorans]